MILKNRRTWISTAAFMIVLIVVGLFFFHPQSPLNRTDGNSSVQENVSVSNIALPLVNLEGYWYAENNGSRFSAEVSENIITIKLFYRDDNGAIYWRGTFQASEESGQSIVSSAMDDKAVLSSDKSKTFFVTNEAMTFEFQAMGVKKNVVMKRG